MIQWIFAIIAVEAAVELLVDSKFFFKLRNWTAKYNPGFLGELFSCGYCLSVWVAASIAWFLPGEISTISVVDFLVRLLVLHRVSNVFHELLSRYFKRLPLMVVFDLIKREEQPPTVPVHEVSDETNDGKKDASKTD